MAARSGVLSSATSGKAIYDLVAADLAANPNWTRPSVPTLTGLTNSHGTNWTSQIWKNTVGAQSWYLILSYDVTTNVNDLWVQHAEAYDGSDGGGVPAAAKFRRFGPGGATSAVGDSTTVTPGTTDLSTNVDGTLNQTSPNFGITKLVGAGSAFSYLFKVGNKAVTISLNVAGANRWVHVGAFESLVTGPSDPIPIAQFAHGQNTGAPSTVARSGSTHADGFAPRHPGIGVGSETGAFFFYLAPLHAPGVAFVNTAGAPFAGIDSIAGFGGTIPRWFTKVLVSQAVIHQSREAHDVSSGAPQTFRGYYPDIFAGILKGTAEPQGGGIDAVIIDGVTYYWLGVGCPGPMNSTPTTLQSIVMAVRAD